MEQHIPFVRVLSSKANLIKFFGGDGVVQCRLVAEVAQSLIEKKSTDDMCLCFEDGCFARSTNSNKPICTAEPSDASNDDDDGDSDSSNDEILEFVPFMQEKLAHEKWARKKQRQRMRKSQQKKEQIVKHAESGNEFVRKAFEYCEQIRVINSEMLEKLAKIEKSHVSYWKIREAGPKDKKSYENQF